MQLGIACNAINSGHRPEASCAARLMFDLLSNGKTPAPKAWLRSILGSIVVGDKTIRIAGSKEVLASAVTGRNFARKSSWFCSEMARRTG